MVQNLEHLLEGSSYKEIDRIACVVGPGGFTSLRVAVGLSNTLADQLKVDQCGVHLSDVYAARAQSKNIYWLHSTKKNELFVKQEKKFPEAVCMKADEFFADQSGEWVGELIPDQRAMAEAKGWLEAKMRPPESVLPDFLARQEYATQNLVPWYGRGW